MTGKFLPNGVEKVLNGQAYYGYLVGSDFISADGDTIILADGTKVTGSLDSGGEVFTSSSGVTYIVTESGIDAATYQPDDGSYLLGNGETVMTAQSWTVDMSRFEDAIQFVQGKASAISDSLMTIGSALTDIEIAWTSPAGSGFVGVADDLSNDMQSLNATLDGVVKRMKDSYQAYLVTEQQALKTMSGASQSQGSASSQVQDRMAAGDTRRGIISGKPGEQLQAGELVEGRLLGSSGTQLQAGELVEGRLLGSSGTQLQAGERIEGRLLTADGSATPAANG